MYFFLFTDNKIVIPESLAIQLANSSEVSPENFIKILLRTYESRGDKNVVVKQIHFSSKTTPSETNETALTPTSHQMISQMTTSATDAFFKSTPISTIPPFVDTSASNPLPNNFRNRTHQLLEALHPPRLIASEHISIPTYGDDEEDTEEIEDRDYEGSGLPSELNTYAMNGTNNHIN